MKKIIGLIVIFILLPAIIVFAQKEKNSREVNTETNNENKEIKIVREEVTDFQEAELPKLINLDVPFTSEIPDGSWVGPWKNACEEASIVMVNDYYAGVKNLSTAKAKEEMQRLFNIENKIFGSNADTNAARTNRLINEYLDYSSRVVENPTFDDIKAEVRAGRPVITPLYGFYLKNPNIHFRVGGTYYHMFVIVGYDEDRQEFIVNDPGDDKTGLDYRYSYDIIRKSLGDYNHTTHKVSDPPRALFTSAKEQLVRVRGTTGIFLWKDGKIHYIAHPKLVKLHGWSWSNIKDVERVWLEALPKGEAIRE
ncbi:MAG TPA: C39 family peptidase [Patescibacteria group bacterium]|nr:C39 family peptidase [Patescibacteria group bacterium]